jgi:hypothetical protein
MSFRTRRRHAQRAIVATLRNLDLNDVAPTEQQGNKLLKVDPLAAAAHFLGAARDVALFPPSHVAVDPKRRQTHIREEARRLRLRARTQRDILARA